jgi:hypothetical protein
MRVSARNKGVAAMNQFFYESRGKEKVKDLLEEGLRSQAVRRSGIARAGFPRNLPRLALTILGLLGLLGILLR